MRKQFVAAALVSAMAVPALAQTTEITNEQKLKWGNDAKDCAVAISITGNELPALVSNFNGFASFLQAGQKHLGVFEFNTAYTATLQQTTAILATDKETNLLAYKSRVGAMALYANKCVESYNRVMTPK